MAIKGFAAGALVTAPVVATLTWLAVTWQQHVDLRVERDTIAARVDRASFNAKFDQEWAAMNGKPRTECDPAAVDEISRLRSRLVSLEEKLAGSSKKVEQNVRDLDALMTEEK